MHLANSSTWLDLIPVLKARVNDAGAAWNVSSSCGGRDITALVKNANGFCFYKADRLNPGADKTVVVTVASRTSQVSRAPFSITLQLLPHPTTPTINQTLRLQN